MCNMSRNVNLLQCYFSIFFTISMVEDATKKKKASIDKPVQMVIYLR